VLGVYPVLGVYTDIDYYYSARCELVLRMDERERDQKPEPEITTEDVMKRLEKMHKSNGNIKETFRDSLGRLHIIFDDGHEMIGIF
jgi:hypothetical protein